MKLYMDLKWSDFSINFTHLEATVLLYSWKWLIGDEKIPILINSIGDVFYQDKENNIHWLMVGQGETEKVADSLKEFEEKLKNQELFEEWFLPYLVAEIQQNHPQLEKGTLYGYKVIPTLGGKYEAENYEVTDIEVHFDMCGQLQRRIKDLPHGTAINSAKFE